MSRLLRPTLAGLPTYKPGRAALGAIKLSSNENPFPPLPGVLEAATAELLRMNTYPDAAASGMLGALAAHFDVPLDHLATGTGSVGLLQQLVQISAGEGDEVVYAWRSFEAYPIVVQVNGATGVPVPLDGEHHDLDAMVAAITPRTRMVLLCSPNNPTGTVIARDGFEAFMAQVPSDVLVVLDEAYAEFVRDDTAVQGLALTGRFPNLVVLRTFSKAYGLAGLRVGYAVAAPPVASALRSVALAFGVSAVAQAAVIASLGLSHELGLRVETLVAERTRVTAGLRELGFVVPDSHANFVWLRPGAASTAFAAGLEQAGLIVRPYGDDGVRVTIADPAANDRLLAAVARSGLRELALAG